MKLMVSVFLLVAICHAAEASWSRQEEEERTAKRELQEGNFGLKIQPSFFESASRSNLQALYDGGNMREEGPPQREYGPPRQPIAKISDVLSGQGPSFPAAIQSHLFSPVPVYQPRLGSPTSFEVSPPVPSQLTYSEHKTYQPTLNIQSLNENLLAQNNNQPPLQPPQLQQPPVQFNSFPAFSQLQPPRQPQPILSNDFLPQLGNNRLLPHPDFPQQIYQQVFSEQPGVIPQDIYQQINQLGSQPSYEGTVQLSQGSNDDTKENNDSGNAKQEEQKAGIQYASETQEQGQLIADQSRAPQQKSSTQLNTTPQPQAVSYASFSQSLPTTSQPQKQEQQVQASPSPEPLLQQQQLPQAKPPQLFNPVQQIQTQSTYQSTQAQDNFQPIQTTPSPSSTFFTTNNQTPQRIGVVRIRQKLTTPSELRTSSTLEPQGSSSSTLISIDTSQPSSTQQSESTRYSTASPSFQSRSTLRPTEGSTTTLRPSTLQSQSTFPSRPTLPALPPLPRRQQTTLQTISSSQFSTSSPQPAFTQTLSTLPPQPVTQTLPTSIPISLQSQFIQPTVEPLLVFQPQQIQSVSTQRQPLSTVQPFQQLTTLQPLIVTQPQELPTSSQSNTAGIRPIPVQRQQFQAQSEPQSDIQFQVYKSEEKLQEQVPQQPQLQSMQGSQQIQQQLQSIQQQLQLIQQHPQLIQQQPQTVQIIEQEAQAFPQPVQLIQEQPIAQLVQQQSIAPDVQQQLQPVTLIQQQPQLIQSQAQLVQPLPQLIQSQPQQIQLIQQQAQLQQQTQPQQQIELSLQPQTETKQKSQEDQQQNDQQQQQNEQQKQQNEKSEKQGIEASQESNEEGDYYTQLLQNNVYSEELYIQPQHLHPVPVGFPSYAASSLHASPAFQETSTLHASPSFHAASSLHASPHHSSPSFHGHSSHHTPPFSSVQYYGKYAPGIFGGWR